MAERPKTWMDYKREDQINEAADTIVEIMGPTGSSKKYAHLLEKLDGLEADDVEYLPLAQQLELAEVGLKLKFAFGDSGAKTVVQFWEGAAGVRKAYKEKEEAKNNRNRKS